MHQAFTVSRFCNLDPHRHLAAVCIAKVLLNVRKQVTQFARHGRTAHHHTPAFIIQRPRFDGGAQPLGDQVLNVLQKLTGLGNQRPQFDENW